jgi:methylated-DNA-[protein]-cysteine S-methyltransferase
VAKTQIRTPIGIAEITGDKLGISEVKILEEGIKSNDEVPTVLLKAVEQLEAYFNGEITSFTLQLNPEGTIFQKKVWNSLAKIPYGTTNSYLQLSQKLGNIKAIRAVAAANGKNPLWIVVPCHRVIGSDGSLTGYAGGLWRKKWLLQHENPLAQQSLFV